jgi:hypothetical protein
MPVSGFPGNPLPPWRYPFALLCFAELGKTESKFLIFWKTRIRNPYAGSRERPFSIGMHFAHAFLRSKDPIGPLTPL